jgi:hypothetical protein
VVTLIDGEAIVGHCGGSPESDDRSASFEQDLQKWQFFTDDVLVLSYRETTAELRLNVPVAEIAQIRTLEVSQPTFGGKMRATESDPDELRSRLEEQYLSYYPPAERPLRRAIRDRQSAELERWVIDTGLPSDWPSSIVEDELSDVDFAVRARKLTDLLRASAVRRAVERHYEIDKWEFGFSPILVATVTVDGDFAPKPGERLYVDWDWIGHQRSTLDGLGFGFIVSATVEWTLSDARAAQMMARKSPFDLGAICQRETPTLVRGYVTFLEMPSSILEDTTVSAGEAESIEGSEWRKALVADRPLAEPPTKDIPWVLTYWRKGCQEVPFEMLDRSIAPIDVFGSIHATPARLSSEDGTSFGETSCAMRVRYASAASTGWQWAKTDGLFGRRASDDS